MHGKQTCLHSLMPSMPVKMWNILMAELVPPHSIQYFCLSPLFPIWCRIFNNQLIQYSAYSTRSPSLGDLVWLPFNQPLCRGGDCRWCHPAWSCDPLWCCQCCGQDLALGQGSCNFLSQGQWEAEAFYIKLNVSCSLSLKYCFWTSC